MYNSMEINKCHRSGYVCTTTISNIFNKIFIKYKDNINNTYVLKQHYSTEKMCCIDYLECKKKNFP